MMPGGDRDRFEALLGWSFRDEPLLAQALAHRSWCAEHPEVASNERLEFLGDAVLGIIVTDHVYRTYPELQEGHLAKVRASVVNADVLAEVAARIELGPCLRLGKGEDASGGRQKTSILSDALEAIIAAVYLDGGIEAARSGGDGSCSASASPMRPAVPVATTTRRGSRSSPRSGSRSCRATRSCDEGPDHAKRFFATVMIGGAPRGQGEGGSKKQAEQAARACRVAVAERAGDRGADSRRRPLRRTALREQRGSRATDRHPTAPGQDPRWGERMPELPEVEVVRRDLEKEVIGKKIKSVDVNGMRSIRRYRQRKLFTEQLDGRKFTSVERRGKYLVLKMDDGNALIIHLGMSGQLLRAKTAREAVPKHTHVTITFTQGGQLRFVDPRTFGEMFVTPYDGMAQDVEELAHLGLDPLETAMSWDYFGELFAQRHMKLKTAADGPEVHGRDRQHLLRRDPVHRRAAVGPHERLALTRGGPPVVPLRGGDAAGRGEVPRVVPGRRAVRRPVRQQGRVSAPPQGLRA